MKKPAKPSPLLITLVETLIIFVILSPLDNNRAEAGNSESSGNCQGIGVPSEAVILCEECHVRDKGLEPNNRSEACDFCHGDGGGSGKQTKMMDVEFGRGHRLGYTGHSPDTDQATPYSVIDFSCLDCHVSHGDNKKELASHNQPGSQRLRDSLLRGNPNPANTADHNFEGKDVSLTDWCSSCHEGNGAMSNGGAPKDHRTGMIVYDEIADDWIGGFSHDCSSGGSLKGGLKYAEDGSRVTDTLYVQVEPLDEVNQGPTCQECHSAPDFPHQGSGISSADGSPDYQAGDEICLSCHPADALP